MNQPRKVCYREGQVGVCWDVDQDVMFLDREHFDIWAATQDKEKLLRTWFLPEPPTNASV